ncbi:MAG: hypothetical protein GC178_18365 [Flavobacteriales bacterium]|nr:hypothetical protein [Flavobacteriales bacterium]
MRKTTQKRAIASIGTGFGLLLLCVAMLSSCSEKGVRKEEETAERHTRISFLAYTDSLISVETINQRLGTDFTPSSLGRPIGVSGTPYWIITVGPWYMNNRNILVQGTSFESGNPFYPNPIRKVEVEFEGPFTGVIKYDQEKDTYSWLLPKGVEYQSFDYQRTAKRHLFILERSTNGLRLVDVGSGKELEVTSPNGELLDWSLNEEAETMVFLMKPSENGELVTEEFNLNELLPND